MEEIFPEGSERRNYVWRFTTLIVPLTLIAAFGLLSNSAAVVIGAMLVAPLMTPILGVGAAVVHGQLGRLAFSARLGVGGTALAIFTGAAVSALAPGTATSTELTGELLAPHGPDAARSRRRRCGRPRGRLRSHPPSCRFVTPGRCDRSGPRTAPGNRERGVAVGCHLRSPRGVVAECDEPARNHRLGHGDAAVLNGKVERSHRIDQEEFYRMLDGVVIDDTILFNDKLQEWEDFYNFNRPHGGLGGQTPYERLRQKTRNPV
jgi:hypothetical protein